jgi:hypothetical protein
LLVIYKQVAPLELKRRVEFYADAIPEFHAEYCADLRADARAEPFAVVGADRFARKNGSDAETRVEIGASRLCRKNSADAETDVDCHIGIIFVSK